MEPSRYHQEFVTVAADRGLAGAAVGAVVGDNQGGGGVLGVGQAGAGHVSFGGDAVQASEEFGGMISGRCGSATAAPSCPEDQTGSAPLIRQKERDARR
ncbi:hypothetical protein ACWEFD_31770 [Streptomyces ardesiacus]